MAPFRRRLGPEADSKAQVNLTDADSRIMKVSGQGVTPIAPLIALGRERHPLDLMPRFGPEPLGPLPADPMRAMAHRPSNS